VVLTRGRVRLEPWSTHHEEQLLVAAQGEDVWRWIPVPRVTDLQGLHRFRDRPRDLCFVVVVDGVAAGSTSFLDVDVAVEGLEIGATWYRQDLWGSDVNPTCKLLLLGHAFEDLGVARVTLKTDALNTRSRAAIAKLGCAYDGTLRHAQLRADGSVRDTAYFSMLASEWPAARDVLVSRASAA
jgi:RimJ/RimL family protein N-acetyltransferase